MYLDVVTTGFNTTVVHGYIQTGDTVQYGGNSYVCILDATNQKHSINGGVNVLEQELVDLTGES